MRKAQNIVKEWTELAEGCLFDGPPKKPYYEYYLFINHCRVKKSPTTGRLTLERKTDVKFVQAGTKRGVMKLVRDFVSQKGVRLLVKGLESNDFTTLPKRQVDVPQSIIRGTAAIYQH